MLIITIIIYLYVLLLFQEFKSVTYFALVYHSHKERKDSVEGSLDRVLFAAEL